MVGARASKGMDAFRRAAIDPAYIFEQSGSQEEVIPASGRRTLRSVLTSAATPDQVHACQMMTEVATVSIVAKNKYSGKAGGRPIPTRGATNVRKPFTRVKMTPAMIFVQPVRSKQKQSRRQNHGDGY